MIKRPSTIITGLALAGLVWSLPALAADPSPKPFEKLQPAPSAPLTNINSPPARKDGLKAFEDEITKSFQSFSPRSTLDGMLAPEYQPPPPRLVIPNRKPKDELDWKSQFGTEKDDKGTFNGLDAFRDGFSNNKREGSGRKNNSIEEFYKEMERQNQGKQGSTRSKRPDGFDLDADSKLPNGIRESAKTLQEKLFGTEGHDNLFKQDSGNSWFSDLFRSEKPNGLSRDDIQAHKEYVDRFKQILDSSAPNEGVNQSGLSAFGGAESSKSGNLTPGVNRLDSFGPAAKHDALASTPGTIGSVANPTIFPDFNAQVLNSWNPLYSPPKQETPKSGPPVPPPTTWDAPRRRF